MFQDRGGGSHSIEGIIAKESKGIFKHKNIAFEFFYIYTFL